MRAHYIYEAAKGNLDYRMHSLECVDDNKREWNSIAWLVAVL